MGSLALLVALIIFSFWMVAGLSLLAAFLGFRTAGLVLGSLSVLAGAWLLCVLPHVPLLGLVNLAAGGFAIYKWRRR